MGSENRALLEDQAAGETISQIVPLQSDPNMRRVRVGRRTMATLRAADVETLGLKVGQRWTESIATAVLAEVAANKARRDALGMLGRRAYSRGEIAQRLQKKGYDQATAARIADEMAADGWVDDEAYGRAIVAQASRRKPAAEPLLLARLEKRKLNPELAQRIARDAAAGIDPVKRALEMARDRLADWESMPAAKAARRVAGMLSRRGFDEEVVADVIARLGLAVDRD